jgi:hypothetical protein
MKGESMRMPRGSIAQPACPEKHCAHCLHAGMIRAARSLRGTAQLRTGFKTMTSDHICRFDGGFWARVQAAVGRDGRAHG